MGIEPMSSAWKADVLTVVRPLHKNCFQVDETRAQLRLEYGSYIVRARSLIKLATSCDPWSGVWPPRYSCWWGLSESNRDYLRINYPLLSPHWAMAPYKRRLVMCCRHKSEPLTRPSCVQYGTTRTIPYLAMPISSDWRLVGQVGFEPTMFHKSGSYSPLRSPLRTLTHISGGLFPQSTKGHHSISYEDYNRTYVIDPKPWFVDFNNHWPVFVIRWTLDGSLNFELSIFKL